MADPCPNPLKLSGADTAHNPGMRRSDPTNNVMPRWATFLVTALPGLGTGVTLILLNLFDVRITPFNLSPRDGGLVVDIGLLLVFLILALLIYCMALMRALRRAVRQSTQS